MSLEELFCNVDDYVAGSVFRFGITSGQRRRQRCCRWVLSEILTILIAFHPSNDRTFKWFDLSCACQQAGG